MSNKKIKIIFIGTSEFAEKCLQALIAYNDFKIIAAITQPDKKSGRGYLLNSPPVKQTALKNKIPVLQPEKIKDFTENIKKMAPDIIVVAAYAQILPVEILTIPKYGCLNVHASLLPKYRGSACIQAAILNNEKETGITIIKMDEKIDAGPILNQKKLPILATDTSISLHQKLADLGANMLPETIINYLKGKIKPIQQDETKVIFAKKLKKEDGHINWNQSAQKIERLIRALQPWPSAFSFLPPDKKIIKIISAKTKQINIKDCQPGELFSFEKKLAVKCGDYILIIEKLQIAGKKPISGQQFINGYKNYLGKILL